MNTSVPRPGVLKALSIMVVLGSIVAACGSSGEVDTDQEMIDEANETSEEVVDE